MKNIFSPFKKIINLEFVNKINISDVTFAVFDTETTGLEYNKVIKFYPSLVLKLKILKL